MSNSPKWRGEYSVGNLALDDQHKTLFALCDRVATIVQISRDSQRNSELHSVLDELFHYTQEHFRTEEAFLAKIGYPELEAHKQEHTAFLSQVSEWLLSAMSSRIVAVDLLSFVTHWIEGHVIESDGRYGKFQRKSASISTS